MSEQPLHVIELPLFTNAPLFIPRHRAADARKYISSFVAIGERIRGEPAITRLVDLDCGCGEFATFAGVRFPYAWLDCFHCDDDANENDRRADRQLIEVNAPTGTRIFDKAPEVVPECDAIHVGLRAKGLQFAGPSLRALRLAIWEWDTSEAIENQIGFMRTIGLDVMHVQTIEPGRGWSLFFRKRGLPFFLDGDMTRKPVAPSSPTGTVLGTYEQHPPEQTR